MIRLATNNDIDIINELGLLISDKFSTLYNFEELLKKGYIDIYVYEEENNILGFIQMENHYEISDLINIAVCKDKQGNGIASKLLQYVISNVKSEKILLEVRDNNEKAIALYNKFQFKEINRRKKYYGDRDAIIMERVIR